MSMSLSVLDDRDGTEHREVWPSLADGTRLEHESPLTGTGGSNPSTSAIKAQP